MDQFTVGLAVEVSVSMREGCEGSLEFCGFSNYLAVVLCQSVGRVPSEWSVGLGFHLNGPLASVSI